MKNSCAFIFLLLLGISFQSLPADIFKKNILHSESLAGLYQNDKNKKILYIRDESIDTTLINKTNFLKIKLDTKLSIFKYKIDNEKLNLYTIKPDGLYIEADIVDKVCEKLKFDYPFFCRLSEYKYLREKKLQEKEYDEALASYLSRNAKSFETIIHTFIKKEFVSKLPIGMKDTDKTSFSLVDKDYEPTEPDHTDMLESLSYLSFSDSKVNIFINGLDFREGTPNNRLRHTIHKKDWKVYYASEVFKKEYNLVYSWDSSLGITKANTAQLENLLKFILQNNPNNNITLIAHSHGGNLSKQVLVNLHKENIGMKNIDLITLATPHKGIKEIDKTTKYLVPVAEIMYDMFSLNFDKHNQMIQASKRIYNEAYKQLEDYNDNPYLQNLNQEFVEYKLHENTLFIAGRYDKIVNQNSSLFEGIKGRRKYVNNYHGDIVDKPDSEIFTIIYEFKNR